MSKTILTDNRVSGKCTEGLQFLGCAVIRLPSFWGLQPPVSSHPDMLFFRLRDGRLVTTREYHDANRVFFGTLPAEFTLTDEKLRPEYPSDVLFDALSVGGTVYGREDSVSRLILDDADGFVPVKQGYARCSVALLSENCAVTADKGLYNALSSRGCDVLLIRPGHIALDGYDTGFIGGAGGCFGDGMYCFFGDILSHPDGAEIVGFAKKHKIKAVSLSDEPLSDHGGFIVL